MIHYVIYPVLTNTVGRGRKYGEGIEINSKGVIFT